MKRLGYLSILIVAIITISCVKDKAEGEYHLSEQLKSCLPLQGHEELFFNADSTDSIILVAGERVNELRKSYLYYPDDYYIEEWDYINFSNDRYSLSLLIFASHTNQDPKGYAFDFQYLDEKYVFGAYFELLPIENKTNFLDSLLVNESYVYDIYYDSMSYVFHDGPFPYEDHTYPVMSYYSKSLGIVKIDFSDNTSWELNEIIW